MWHIKLKEMMSRTDCKLSFHLRVKLVTIIGVKRSSLINSQLQSQFHRFLYQTFLFSLIQGTNIFNGMFIPSPESCPSGGIWGCWVGGQKESQHMVCGISN